MSLIKQQLANLKETDIWSFLLFALFKLHESPEYSAISELAYILDKKNLLRLCEYFGGLTIKIPTISELESLIGSLQLYQSVDINNKNFDEALDAINGDKSAIKKQYLTIRELLDSYQFSSRGKV